MPLIYRLWYSASHDFANSVEAKRLAEYGETDEWRLRRHLGFIQTRGVVRVTAKFLYDETTAETSFERANSLRAVGYHETAYRRVWQDAVFLGLGIAPEGDGYNEPYPDPWVPWDHVRRVAQKPDPPPLKFQPVPDEDEGPEANTVRRFRLDALEEE